MDLINKLNETSNLNRLNTVEAALAGSPGAQTNFKGTWQGFNDSGQGLVKVNGKIYATQSIGGTSIPLGHPVILRAGRDIKNSNW